MFQIATIAAPAASAAGQVTLSAASQAARAATVAVSAGAFRLAKRSVLTNPAATPTSAPKVPVEVHKFGGSSMGSGEAIREVAKVLLDRQGAAADEAGTAGVARQRDLVAVPSAIYGMTNKLLGGIAAADEGNSTAFHDIIDEVRAGHRKAVDHIFDGNEVDLQARIQSDVDAAITAQVEDPLSAVLADSEATASPRLRDAVVTTGERLSSYLLVNAIGADKAEIVDPREVIVTDGVYEGAEPDYDASKVATRSRLGSVFDDGRIGVVPGFYGAPKDHQDEITTLGRGGSDLSAATMAASLDADVLTQVECETDELGLVDKWVDGGVGVYHDAGSSGTIPCLSYSEAAVLARCGKEVLHPETVTPLVDSNIPLRVANTYKPEVPGTLIVPDSVIAEGVEGGAETAAAAGDASVKATTFVEIRKPDQFGLPVDPEAEVLYAVVGLDDESFVAARETTLEKMAGLVAACGGKVVNVDPAAGAADRRRVPNGFALAFPRGTGDIKSALQTLSTQVLTLAQRTNLSV